MIDDLGKKRQKRIKTGSRYGGAMSNKIIENCMVEWNVEQGVLYVHNKDTGATVVRISNIPAMYKRLEELGQTTLIDIRDICASDYAE